MRSHLRSHSSNGADFVDLCTDKQHASTWKRPRRKHSLRAPEIALDGIVLDTPKHQPGSLSSSINATTLPSSHNEQPRLTRAASTPLPVCGPTCVLGIPVDAPLGKLSLTFNDAMHASPAALLGSAVVPPRQSSGLPRATSSTPTCKATLRARLLRALHRH